MEFFYGYQGFYFNPQSDFAAWNRHEAPRLGAALAFYTILSLSPLVIIVVALAGLVFQSFDSPTHILSQVQGMIGQDGGKAVESMLANVQKPAAGILGTIVGPRASKSAAILPL
jgi:membrane protein